MKTKLDFKQIILPYKEDVEREIASFLLANQAALETQLRESVAYSVLNGGKRLRAILSLLTAEAVMRAEEKLPYHANPAGGLALAIELVHCGSLIHDDLPCMDDDDMRRGKATNHKVFGEATALLAGDFLMAYPIKALYDYSPVAVRPKLAEVQTEFVAAICKMIQGQALDLEFVNQERCDIEAIKHKDSLKTGALLKASITLAALLAGASEAKIQAFDFFASNLGQAFQIIDDVLDCTASTETMGKATGKDAGQNKHTYVKEYGIDQSKQIAQDLITAAKQKLLDTHVYADKLNLVADYVVSRNN